MPTQEEAKELTRLAVALHPQIKLGPKLTPEEYYREWSQNGRWKFPESSRKKEIARKFSIENKEPSIARNLHDLTRRLLEEARKEEYDSSAAVLQGFLTLMEMALGRDCFDPRKSDDVGGKFGFEDAVQSWIEGDPSARERGFESYQDSLLSIGPNLANAIVQDKNSHASRTATPRKGRLVNEPPINYPRGYEKKIYALKEFHKQHPDLRDVEKRQAIAKISQGRARGVRKVGEGKHGYFLTIGCAKKLGLSTN